MQTITRLTGMTDKWFYKLINVDRFPKQIKFGTSSRWLESEVRTWLEARIAESRH
jgi:predicted DNA-binding transcriptional regulator AlpA